MDFEFFLFLYSPIGGLSLAYASGIDAVFDKFYIKFDLFCFYLYDFSCLISNYDYFHNCLFSYLLQDVFINDPDWVVEDVDFSHTHLVLTLREGRNFRLCSVALPLPAGKVVNNNNFLRVCVHHTIMK